MRKEIWYFTFCIGKSLENCVQPIEGDSETSRNIMFDTYGRNWAFQYDEDTYKRDLTKYNYKVLPILKGEKNEK